MAEQEKNSAGGDCLAESIYFLCHSCEFDRLHWTSAICHSMDAFRFRQISIGRSTQFNFEARWQRLEHCYVLARCPFFS